MSPYSALTNPAPFSKDHVKGSVGIIATIDPRNGTGEIHGVVAGSPADKAGLQAGDHVIAVNGLATAGLTLAEDMESITEFSFGSVKLTVQR